MVYLHWTDLIEKSKVPLLFNLFGQEFRELSFEEDEDSLMENELKAILMLKTAKYIDPEQVFQEAIHAWIIAGAEEIHINRAQKAWQQILFESNLKFKSADDPISRPGDIDHLPD